MNTDVKIVIEFSGTGIDREEVKSRLRELIENDELVYTTEEVGE